MKPKYPIGTTIMDVYGAVMKIAGYSTDGLAKVRAGEIVYIVHPSDDYRVYRHYEDEILYAVHIIPIVDKPKCKDCRLSCDGSDWFFDKCPVSQWARSVEDLSLTNETEPPEGSTCFRPKVGHEQKESK
jgi:hypothetical protein